MPTPANVISLGSSLRLYSTGALLEAFAPAGLSKNGLLRLLRILHVPYLQVGSTRYVHLLQFQVALYAVLRIGRRPFAAPGTSRKVRRRCATSCQPVTPGELPDLIAELLYAKKLAAGLALTRATIRRDALTIAQVLAAQAPETTTARALAAFTAAAHDADPSILQTASPLEPPCPTPRDDKPTPPTRSRTRSTPSSAPTGSPKPAGSTASTRPSSSAP